MRKIIFTALATIEDGPRKRLKLKSADHWQHWINKLYPGKEYAVTVEEHAAGRSQSQLAYYWVLLGYIADETGHTPEELHDAIVRQKFGTKVIKVGAIEQSVRRSIADSARFPKSDMVELIQTVLELCTGLGIVVPTKQELGYI